MKQSLTMRAVWLYLHKGCCPFSLPSFPFSPTFTWDKFISFCFILIANIFTTEEIHGVTNCITALGTTRNSTEDNRYHATFLYRIYICYLVSMAKYLTEAVWGGKCWFWLIVSFHHSKKSVKEFTAARKCNRSADVPHILVDHETETRPEPGIHYNLQGLVSFDSCLKGRPKFSVSLTSQNNDMS